MREKFKVAGAFLIGLSVASSVTFAQLGGRGRNVAFVDGTTISPTSVVASGTSDQFVCSSTTSTCEISSGASSTTTTVTVPAIDIGPTATPSAQDKLVCFSYGPSGSKTRAACIDKEGDGFFSNISGNYINSGVASGSTAYNCTNVGCRLSLGNTGRYLYDTGSTLASIGGLSADTFTATTATGSALTGGGASGAFILTSNTPDSFTDTGNNGAFELRVANALAANDALFVVKNSLNQPRFVITQDGRIVGYSDIRTTTLQPDSLATLNLVGRATSGTGILLRSNGNLSLDTDRAVNIQNNINTDIAHFSKDGLLRVNASNAAKPTCNADNRGRIYYLNGAAGVADTYEVCTKNSADVYGWSNGNTVTASASSGSAFVANSNTRVCLDGTSCTTHLSYNSASTRAELSYANGTSLFVVGSGGTRVTAGSFVVDTSIDLPGTARLRNAAITIADSGGAGAATYTQSTYTTGVRYTCNDADGCDVTMSEVGAVDGFTMNLFNLSANTVNFTDTAGVTELAGNFAMGQYDSLTLKYVDDRWIEVSRSNN